jgi:fatty-acid desaturase
MFLLAIVCFIILFIEEKHRNRHTTPYSWAEASKKWESNLYK